ncbi:MULTISPECIES: IclR family transcriptional regulator [Oceanobacillus]|uniref:IclR family transcriptional regulator n=1 Tax=Oceanobacillus profundus TaxID=372463 RepID=A0A417YBI2_9BACI|nr:IclR family transcriptional regulator [Oceanobacillus profundus]RHW30040.1 IclR family transcriptional regulator [Oceanobacillus profundus]
MKQYNVPALERAISILELISQSTEQYTVTEICTNLDLPKATVFTIMNTLERYKMVEKDTTGRFQIGAKLFQLGMTYLSDYSMIDLAKPYMKKLMKETGFTVHLGILHENSIMYIAKEEPNSFIKFSTYPGLTTEIHLSGLGKAISAYLGDTEIDKILTEEGLKKATNNTITSMEKFRQDLAKVRENGYSLEDEEGEKGVRCIAAPIINVRLQTPTAISITAHISQLEPQQYEDIGLLVKTTAQEISRII